MKTGNVYNGRPPLGSLKCEHLSLKAQEKRYTPASAAIAHQQACRWVPRGDWPRAAAVPESGNGRNGAELLSNSGSRGKDLGIEVFRLG